MHEQTAAAGGSGADRKLALRARGGDRLAFGVLYLAHHEVAWRMACATTAFSADAEIALVEGFARVFGALPEVLDEEFAFRPLLLASVRTFAVERLRQTGRLHDRAALAGLGGPGRPAAVQPGSVRDAFRWLPELWRTTLWLNACEAASPHEIAAVTGLEPDAAAVIASLAWDKVRDICLAALDVNPPARCRETVSALGSYLRGEASQAARQGVEDHFALCGRCAVHGDHLADPRSGLRAATIPVPPLAADTQHQWIALGSHQQWRRPVVSDRPRRPVGRIDHEERISLDPVTASVPAARRFVESALGRWGTTEILGDVQLLASELVTNAVVHARTTIELVLTQRHDVVRLEVHDRRVRVGPVTTVERGRGVQLIEGLAQQWGIVDDGSGRTVWLEIPCVATQPDQGVAAYAGRSGGRW
jgi:DNA-directed RNA polymerase specialized sigma24 family protein/anti-sigma regulatory factor (Ser/Thr protein kinase)